MAAAVNLNYTSIYFSLAPRSYSGQSYNYGGNTYDVYGGESSDWLVSVNTPLNIQVIWNDTGLGQDQEGTGGGGERVAGDLVNVLFDIYEGSTHIDGALTLAGNYTKVCTIKKSRDVPYKYNGRPKDISMLLGHRFTIDIAPVLADLLSYSLTPPGIGTWGGLNDGSTGPQLPGGNDMVNIYGGMNGQWTMNNVHSTVANQYEYNLSANGADRRITVRARFEVLSADGGLEMATNPSSRSVSDFWIVNSVPQLGDMDMQHHNLNKNNNANGRFLTRSPNFNSYASVGSPPDDTVHFKKIRYRDNAEYLQWWSSYVSDTGNTCSEFAIRVDISSSKNNFDAATTVFLVDFASGGRARTEGTSASNYYFNRIQFRQFTQNVSVDYINKHNNGANGRLWDADYVLNPINTTAPYYRCSLYCVYGGVSRKPTGYQYYELDVTTTKGNWQDALGMQDGVKFMWLNRDGGIDSYTAKRDITSSVEVEQNTITKLTPYRRFSYDMGKSSTPDPMNSSILSDMYPHEREALNVNANKNYTVFTDPLTVPEAIWLEELLTSPNVWIVQDTARSENWSNSSGQNEIRPSKYTYVPVLITNGGTVMIDEAVGLAQMQIEFTESSSINTQRN